MNLHCTYVIEYSIERLISIDVYPVPKMDLQSCSESYLFELYFIYLWK